VLEAGGPINNSAKDDLCSQTEFNKALEKRAERDITRTSSRIALDLACCKQHTGEGICHVLVFFGHRPNFVLNDRQKINQCGHNFRKYRLLNTVAANFNAIMG